MAAAGHPPRHQFDHHRIEAHGGGIHRLTADLTQVFVTRKARCSHGRRRCATDHRPYGGSDEP